MQTNRNKIGSPASGRHAESECTEPCNDSIPQADAISFWRVESNPKTRRWGFDQLSHGIAVSRHSHRIDAYRRSLANASATRREIEASSVTVGDDAMWRYCTALSEMSFRHHAPSQRMHLTAS